MMIKRKFVWLYFVSASALFLLCYNFTTMTTPPTTTVIFIATTTLAHIPTPLILLWTDVGYWIPEELNEQNCELKCEFTYDRNQFNISRGVMFYWRSIESDDLPNFHPDEQFWSLHHDESPAYTEELPTGLETEINWPVTYRTDSSIPALYGKTVKREIPITYEFKTSFETKTRSIAWFVSHCETDSEREKLVEELANYIDIDIYGLCGNFSCGKRTYENISDTSCYRMAEEKYKFYFSGENSLCNDYVTEKVFYLFDFELIPIVYGGANYSALLPKNSYIDASNFSTPQHLAEFLHDVAQNEKLYYSYFKWKTNHKILNDGPWKDEILSNRYCDVCKAMHNPSTVNDFKGVNINKWWFEGQCVKSMFS